MRGIGARLRQRFGEVQVRSDLALTAGLVLAAVMILVVAVAAVVAVVRLLT
jgi:hypothetical protein